MGSVGAGTWQGPGAFVPADVRTALARGEAPREACEGSVLLADVSGFTPLTEAYARKFGPRRGAEEVAALLDRVYGALVAEVDRSGGTVVAFAGDAICCCYEDDDGAAALRCGLRMQSAMAGLRLQATLVDISVAVAAGSFRRFAVGDPALGIFEVVVGPAIDRVSSITGRARRGEVLADASLVEALGARATLLHERDGCAAVGRVAGPEPAPAPPPPDLAPRQAQPWVPAAIREQLAAAGDEQVVGELRSAVALFAGFDGIDYDAAGARDRLDAYMRFAQAAIHGFGGIVYSLAVDDKGSYLCAGFGAPVAHDDDPRRAAAAALALRDPAPDAPGVTSTGIGLTRGRNYAGVYGGPTRRTFGLQGTKTNLAARLMQLAGAGEILVEEPLAVRLDDAHELQARPAAYVKGRTLPVALRSLVAARARPGAVAPAPGLVNRVGERALLDERLQALLRGEGGVLLLEGEPGIGKSRLIRHLADRAADSPIVVHAGAGDPIERGAAYHGWRAVFGGPGLPWQPEAALGGGLSGDARAEATRDMLAARLAAMASTAPTLVVLEDAHWLDSASLALATRIAMAPVGVLLVLTTRPVAEAALDELERFAATEACRRVAIGPLRATEIRAVAAGALGSALPARVAALVEAKAGGNPLFSRELALALRDRGLLDGDAALEDELESPDSVEGVIAGRIDRLPARAQALLKVGSVLGRVFDAGALRELGGPDSDDQLAVLEELDLVGREPDGELAFRHAIIRDVVYEQLLYADRRELHRRAALYLGAGAGATHAVLAHHWDRAEVPDRAAMHFAAAGEEAFQAGAFRECVDMLERALELSGDAIEPLRQASHQWQIAESCYRLGELEQCRRRAEQAIATLDRAVPAQMAPLIGACLRELARQTIHRLAPRRPARTTAGPDRERLRLAAESQLMMAEVYYLSSDTPRSSYVALRSLNLAERLGPSTELASCYGAICIIAGIIGLHAQAEHYGALGRRTADELGEPFAIALTLHQQCMYRSTRGPYEHFADEYERCIEGFRRLGHKPRLRDAVGIAAIGDHLFGRPAGAERKMLDLLASVEPQESSLGVGWAHAWLGIVALRRGDPRAALARLRIAAGLSRDHALDMTTINVHAMSALALRRCGDDGAARDEEATAWELVERLGPRPTSHGVLDGYVALAELAMLRWDEARSWRGRLRARERAGQACRNLRLYERTFTIGGPARWLYEGERVLRAGHREAALRSWERACARAAELDMRHELALAHAVLGDHLPSGSADRERHRETAARMLRELGAPAQTRPVTALRSMNPEAVDVEH